MALSARWEAAASWVGGRCFGSGRWWKRLMASCTHVFFGRTTLTLVSAVWRLGGCQQFDNLIDGLVGTVGSGCELGGGEVFWIGEMVEAADGELYARILWKNNFNIGIGGVAIRRLPAIRQFD